MRITKISNHWLLEADGYITENKKKAIEERSFFKTIRVSEESLNSFREATEEELSAWKDFKKRQEEEYANG